MLKRLFLYNIIISGGVLLGRISGYIRELLIAYKFEVSNSSDEIILMLTTPDLLNNLLAGGVMSGLLIPALSRNPIVEPMLSEFTRKLFIFFLFLYIALGVVLILIYDSHLTSMLLVSLLVIFPNIITFVSSSYLQFKKRFAAQSLNTLVFNFTIIVILILGFKNFLFAFGIIAAAFIRMFWVAFDLRSTDVNLRNILPLKDSNFFNSKTLIAMIFANGLIFIFPMLDKVFAYFLEDGAVSILSYAEKIYLFPVSVFLTTFSVAIFPDLSLMVAQKKHAKIKALLFRSVSLNLILSVFFALVIFYFNEGIVSLFYGLVNVGDDNIKAISNVLGGYVFTVVLAGTNSILLNLFFAYKWHKKLLYYSIGLLLIKLSLNFTVICNQFDLYYIALNTSLLILVSILFLSINYFLYSKSVL